MWSASKGRFVTGSEVPASSSAAGPASTANLSAETRLAVKRARTDAAGGSRATATTAAAAQDEVHDPWATYQSFLRKHKEEIGLPDPAADGNDSTFTGSLFGAPSSSSSAFAPRSTAGGSAWRPGTGSFDPVLDLSERLIAEAAARASQPAPAPASYAAAASNHNPFDIDVTATIDLATASRPNRAASVSISTPQQQQPHRAPPASSAAAAAAAFRPKYPAGSFGARSGSAPAYAATTLDEDDVTSTEPLTVSIARAAAGDGARRAADPTPTPQHAAAAPAAPTPAPSAGASRSMDHVKPVLAHRPSDPDALTPRTAWSSHVHAGSAPGSGPSAPAPRRAVVLQTPTTGTVARPNDSVTRTSSGYSAIWGGAAALNALRSGDSASLSSISSASSGGTPHVSLTAGARAGRNGGGVESTPSGAPGSHRAAGHHRYAAAGVDSTPSVSRVAIPAAGATAPLPRVLDAVEERASSRASSSSQGSAMDVDVNVDEGKTEPQDPLPPPPPAAATPAGERKRVAENRRPDALSSKAAPSRPNSAASGPPRTTASRSGSSSSMPPPSSGAAGPARVAPAQRRSAEQPQQPPGAKFDSVEVSPEKKRHVVYIRGRKYKYGDTIGHGGSSTVYQAVPEGTKTVVAIKRVKLDAEGSDESSTKMWLDEAAKLKQLNDEGCKSVIKLFTHEVDLKGKRLYLVMELGEMDMAKAIAMRTDKPIDLNFIRYYWRNMVECVHALHQHKTIHADLKPANFVLVKSELKLIDFGIAKTMAHDTTKAHFDSQVGTMNYMSPEGIRGTVNKDPPRYQQHQQSASDDPFASSSAAAPATADAAMQLNRKADVWSLGCILYQLLYGRAPFARLTMGEKFNRIPDPRYPIAYPRIRRGMAPSAPGALVAGPLGFDGVNPAPLHHDDGGSSYNGRGEFEDTAFLVDCIHRCLHRGLDARADTATLLEHPFVMPENLVGQERVRRSWAAAAKAAEAAARSSSSASKRSSSSSSAK
ncbi:Serine/threonine kinase mps1 [Blastocladiella emersonii ATCC 22665]|nr:Serine/threonine kinase mps1 [Blastocladiella emersonii ATCC 22665]